MMKKMAMNGERCGNCSEAGEDIYYDDDDNLPTIGDKIVCRGCFAVHDILADGIKFNGEFDSESGKMIINRERFPKDFS